MLHNPRAGSDGTLDIAEYAAEARGSTVPLQVPALPLSLPSDVSMSINPALLFRKHRQRAQALLEVTQQRTGSAAPHFCLLPAPGAAGGGTFLKLPAIAYKN